MLVICYCLQSQKRLAGLGRKTTAQRECTRAYDSVNEARDALLSFGLAEEVLNECLKLLPQLGTGQRLKFPPLDVPHHHLVAEGFKLGIG
jgi:hypothetical protein